MCKSSLFVCLSVCLFVLLICLDFIESTALTSSGAWLWQAVSWEVMTGSKSSICSRCTLRRAELLIHGGLVIARPWYIWSDKGIARLDQRGKIVQSLSADGKVLWVTS